MTSVLARLGLTKMLADDAKGDDDDDMTAEEKAAAEAEAEAELEAAAVEDGDDKDAQEDDEDGDEDEDEDGDDAPASKAARRIAKAKASGVTSAVVYARKIDNLCAVAGRPELAGQFRAKGVSLSDCGNALIELRASDSAAAEISGQRGPDHKAGARIDYAAIYARFNHQERRA